MFGSFRVVLSTKVDIGSFQYVSRPAVVVRQDFVNSIALGKALGQNHFEFGAVPSKMDWPYTWIGFNSNDETVNMLRISC